ncbi:MAG: folate-binding protein [Pseudomonadota bacterium]
MTDLYSLSDRGVLRIAGPEAREFLQGLVTNDVAAAAPDRAIYAALLTPQGKFLFDFFIADAGDGALLLDTDRERLPDLKKRLTLYKLRADVEIEDASGHWSVWADVEAASSAPGAAETDGADIVFTDPRHAGLGRRRFKKGEAIADVEAIARYDAHRLGFGAPIAVADIKPEKSFALESNLDDLNAIDFQKGCYVGQEVTSRTKRRGVVRKRILTLDVEGEAPAPGASVSAGGSEIGEVLSGRGGRALALIRLDRWAAASAQPETEGRPVQIGVPGWLSLPQPEKA